MTMVKFTLSGIVKYYGVSEELVKRRAKKLGYVENEDEFEEYIIAFNEAQVKKLIRKVALIKRRK